MRNVELRMIPVPTTDLVIESDEGITVISYNRGVCKAATLNCAGQAVWQLVDGHNTIDKIAAQLVHSLPTQTDIACATVVADVWTFVVELEREGFILLEQGVLQGAGNDDKTG